MRLQFVCKSSVQKYAAVSPLKAQALYLLRLVPEDLCYSLNSLLKLDFRQ